MNLSTIRAGGAGFEWGLQEMELGEGDRGQNGKTKGESSILLETGELWGEKTVSQNFPQEGVTMEEKGNEKERKASEKLGCRLPGSPKKTEIERKKWGAEPQD